MSKFSDYLEKAIIDWSFGNIAMPATSAVRYVSLHTAAPSESAGSNEVPTAGTNYTRQGLSAGNVTKAQVSGVWTATNNGDITFPTTGTANFTATVTHIGIWTASTSGNLLYWGALGSSANIVPGVVFKILANNLVVSVN